MFSGLGYAEGQLAALNTLGQVAYRRGDHSTAHRLYRDVVAGATRMAHAAAVAEGLELLAETTSASGDAVLAAQLLAAAQGVRVRRDVPRTPMQERRIAQLQGAVPEEVQPAGPPSVEVLLELLERAPAP
jgi:hypothetical protein